jgi:hypothetical protein
LAGGAAATGAPCWPEAAGAAAPGNATAASCWCCEISGFIWSCWSPSLIPKKAAAAADEFDAIALKPYTKSKFPWIGSVPLFFFFALR